MLKIRLAWLWWPHVRHVLPWLRIIWLVDLTWEHHECEFCTRSVKITELVKGRWSWISNCGEAFHTDSWLAEANPGHSDRDAILKALLPGPHMVVLFGPGKAKTNLAMLSPTLGRLELARPVGPRTEHRTQKAEFFGPSLRNPSLHGCIHIMSSLSHVKLRSPFGSSA